MTLCHGFGGWFGWAGFGSLAPQYEIQVAKCIFYMVFGVWLDKEDAEVMARWRDYAACLGFSRRFASPHVLERVHWA